MWNVKTIYKRSKDANLSLWLGICYKNTLYPPYGHRVLGIKNKLEEIVGCESFCAVRLNI